MQGRQFMKIFYRQLHEKFKLCSVICHKQINVGFHKSPCFTSSQPESFIERHEKRLLMSRENE